jgi:hypothetical protein
MSIARYAHPKTNADTLSAQWYPYFIMSRKSAKYPSKT